jgi:hypothetical protein
MKLNATQFEALEWGYHSGKSYTDPFNEVEVDVLFTHTSGKSWRVPAYWAGGQEWRVRFAPPLPGTYQVSSICSDVNNPSLHGQTADLQAAPYTGDHPLLKHGSLQVTVDRRSLEHSDGTPFAWLGDTWWMGFCKRLSWPADFQALTADRVAKGFTLVQIVAGLYPDMPGFDPRGANEAGFPWEPDYARLNPAYFDMADLRIRWLVSQGLTPCIVGCWGYYLPLLGIAKMKQHWRNIVARWGAYPVMWCLAGEARMPYYLSKDKPGDEKMQQAGWTELARYVRSIDSYHRLVTIHPTSVGRDQLLDDSLLDVNMLQTGHDGYKSVPNTIVKVREQVARTPTMPVVVSEVNYDAIIHSTASIQRLTYWASMLSGAYGFTYGANGIWQLNTRNQPYGPSPHGATWGGLPWDEAAQLPGSGQLGLAKKFLLRFDWQRVESHPEWVEPSGGPENVDVPFAAGIPGELRVIYFYMPTFAPEYQRQYEVHHLEAGVRYQAYFWDPINDQDYPIDEVIPDVNGTWTIPLQPELRDWVLVMKKQV